MKMPTPKVGIADVQKFQLFELITQSLITE